MRHALRSLFACGMGLMLSAAQAERPDKPDTGHIDLTAFGTLGVAKTNTDLATYQSLDQDNGARRTASFEKDSRLGVHINASADPRLSFMTQVVTKLNARGNWSPTVDWALARGDLGSGFSARVGRMCMPFFMSSDFHSVGYAYLWVRPPMEVYNTVAFSYFDGADLTYHGNLGSATFNATVLGGSYRMDVPGGAHLRWKNLRGINASLEQGPWSLRAGYIEAKLTFENFALLDSLFSDLRTAAQQPGYASLATLADALAVDDKRVTLSHLGANFDSDGWLAMAELMHHKSKSFLSHGRSYALTLGRRFGRLTPYAVLARSTSQPGVAITQQPPDPALTSLLTSLTAGNAQRTVSLGARWDVTDHVALKAQFDRITVASGGTGQFQNVQRGAGFGAAPVNVVSLVADFVY